MSNVSGSENRLLVPISIEALVIEEKSGKWSDLSLDFSRLYEGYILAFGSQTALGPELFNITGCPHKPGVHLHWAVPAAHRRGGNLLAQARRMAKAHGVLAERLARSPDDAERKRLAKRLDEIGKRLSELVPKDQRVDQLRAKQGDVLAKLSGTLSQEERRPLAKQLSSVGKRLADLAELESQGNLQFPVIPNRWLVRRIWQKPSTNEISVRAWVVESDYRYGTNGETQVEGAITVPIFDALPLFDYVGKSFECSGWQEGQEGKDRAPRVELTALGYGDPAFAAFYPACKSVLGFHDPLNDVQSGTTLTYLVAGWYSDPARDILRYFDMEELNWTCSPPSNSDSYPTQTLCHGSIYNIQWKGTKYPPKAPFLDQSCQIAIGNTSAEGLASLLANMLNKPILETLLTAFNDDLLSKDTDEVQMESHLHQHRFGSSAGGGQFFIQRKLAEPGESLTATDATLPEDLQQSLTDLNVLQQNYDRQGRDLEARRWELYATWNKWALQCLDNRRAPDDVTRILDREKDIIREKEGTLAALRVTLDTKQKDIANITSRRFSDLELINSVSPPFWHANDPVVLISALGLSPSSEPRRDRRGAEKERLFCRVTSQEITALILDIPNAQAGIPVSADQVFRIQDAIPGDTPGMPKGIGELLREALLLDPANADAIAEQTYRNAGLQTRPGKDNLITQIKLLQRTPPSAPREASDASTPAVKRFPPAPIALRDWDGNPWLPLFLEWEVSWQSSYASMDKILENWQLARDDGEFRWKGRAPTNPSPRTYSGYSIVSPNAAWNLQERLEKYNEDKQETNLNQVITHLGEMNILAQTLGGLHTAFLMRDQTPQPRPINPFFGQPGADVKDPIRDFITGLTNLVSPDPEKPFFPIRAGHLKLTRLWIVDAFGQTVEVPTTQLIRASSLKPQVVGMEELAQFPPRFAQPLRLRFDWASAVNPPGTYPVDSPVCGWVIPNHLDHNLLFYDASGVPLGVLQKILRLTAAGGTGGVSNQEAKAFFWVPMPGTSQRPETIHNAELKYFVQFLEGMRADTGDAFWNLLDDALAKTDPGEPEHDPLLSVLLGRPLALARASLQLELEGLPATNQSLEKIGQYDTGGFTKVKFPVCLGDAANDRDGLIGFFIHDSKSGIAQPFFAAAGATQLPGLPVSGVIEYKDCHDVLDCETPVALTLLMDPRAKVHLTTGILPKRSIELSSRVSSAAKSAKEAFFQVSPLISPGGDVSMPLPSDDFGKWSWAYRPQVTMWKEADTITATSDRAGFHPRPQQISEGWLKLKMNPVAILGFWVREGLLEVPMNSNVTLAWILQGGDRLRLLANENEAEPLKVWATPPLPEQFKLQVKATTTFTLILEDKDNNRSEKRLTVRLEEGKGHG